MTSTAILDPVEKVARHRTAMRRSILSRPLQQAFNDGLLDDEPSIFDFGCGRGDDLRALNQLGYQATGWDPAHAPNTQKVSAGVVNLGYVVNVIEDRSERTQTLKDAWDLTEIVLVVSARLVWEPSSRLGKPFKDGRLTGSGTFQKFFEPEELKAWVENSLGKAAVTAAPGILYVFRSDRHAQSLLARHSRAVNRPRQGIAELMYQQSLELLEPLEAFVQGHRRLPNPVELPNSDELIQQFGSLRSAFALVRRATGKRQWGDIELGTRKRSEQRFEEHLDDLQPLMDFISERGRLPRASELPNEAAVSAEFGSLRAAFSLVRKVTGPERWNDFETEARANFLVYCALAAFGGRPNFKQLPDDLQYDVKDLFGSYAAACAESDKLLFSIADLDAINAACNQSPFGKLSSEALYVHVDYVNRLPNLLRVYEGAARAITGDVDDATIVKLNRLKQQVSYLVYPTFEEDPHPPLEASIVSKLGELRVKFRFFGDSENRPILHRKELFVPVDHPSRTKFERLSRQEERAGLLDRADIGNERSWSDALDDAGYVLRGHRLIRATSEVG